MRFLVLATVLSLGLSFCAAGADAQSTYQLLVSTNPDRSAAVPLDGETSVGDIYVFVLPETGIANVEFLLDGLSYHSEGIAPYDLEGGALAAANPFDTTALTNGAHNISAIVNHSGGSVTLSGTFIVNNPTSLTVTPPSLSFLLTGAEIGNATIDVDNNTGSAVPITASSSQTWIEVTASGTTPATLSVSVNTTGEPAGANYQGAITVSSTGLPDVIVPVTMTIQGTGGYDILTSPGPDRGGASSLADGTVLSGDVFIFTGPDNLVTQVRWYWDNTSDDGNYDHREQAGPFDLEGTASNGDSLPYDTLQVSDGPHTLTAAIDLVGGSTQLITRNVTIQNLPPTLAFSPTSAQLTVDQNSTAGGIVTVTSNAGGSYAFTLASNQPWLTASVAGGTTDLDVNYTVDTTGLALGTHSALLSVDSPDADRATFAVEVLVTGAGGYTIFVTENADRSAPQGLDGALSLSGSQYIFLFPDTGTNGVDFYLDNPSQAGAPFQHEGSAPWDLQGGTPSAANPFDTNTLLDGFHTLTAVVSLLGGGEQVVNATFLVQNGAPQLVFNPPALSLAAETDETVASSVSVATNVGTAANFVLAADPLSPWLTVDAAGDTSTAVNLTVDAAGLTPGNYVGTITATSVGLLDGTLTVNLTVFGAGGNFDILVSGSSNRSNGASLNGQNVDGNIYVFTGPDTGVDAVSFYLDDPTASGNPYRREGNAPFDLEGGAANAANPFDTTALSDGPHSLTAVIDLVGGTVETVIASFSVANATPALAFSPQQVFILIDSSGLGSDQAAVSTLDGSSTTVTLLETIPWLSLGQTTVATGTFFDINVDASALSPGSYSGTIDATASGYLDAELQVDIQVAGSDVYDIVWTVNQDLSGTVALAQAQVSGSIFVIVSPEAGIDSVDFYLDDPTTSGAVYKHEGNPPFALEGGPASATKPFDTTALLDGSHSVAAILNLSDGSQVTLLSFFEVVNGAPALEFATPSLPIIMQQDDVNTVSVDLNTTTGQAANYTLVSDSVWLTPTAPIGTTPSPVSLEVNTFGLALGSYSATITASAPGFTDAILFVNLNVQGQSNFDLMLSTAPDRSNPVPLQGAIVDYGNIYVFLSPEAGVGSVEFWVDDPSMIGNRFQLENNPPFDLAGGVSGGLASPFDSADLVDGIHTITALVHQGAGFSEVVSATFFTANTGPTLLATPQSLDFLAGVGSTAPPAQSVGIVTNDDAVVPFAITSSNPSWLSMDVALGTTPMTVNISVDPTGLVSGAYNGTITASAVGYAAIDVPVVFTVGQGLCDPLPCDQLLVSLPYLLTFDEDHGGVEVGIDTALAGSGFTMILPSTYGDGYLPERVTLDDQVGLLYIDSTGGAFSREANSQDNALGVGLNIPSQVTLISTELVNLPAMTGAYEQAGLWFGLSDRNHLKLFVNSGPSGDRVRFMLEENDVQATQTFNSPVQVLSGQDVELTMRINPVDRTVGAFYSVNGGSLIPLGEHSPPPEFFSFDAAGIDPEIGTRSFAGIFASHRNALDSQRYSFEYFSADSEPLPPPQTPIAFDRQVFATGVNFPTNMAWGPDGRLYVLELAGYIKAYTLGADSLPIGPPEVITTFVDVYGPRLALGLEVDPNSTPLDVVLWVNHSDFNQSAGDINSGTVSRLSGLGFNNVEDVITGLPRAFANHAPNSLHFGPDGWLYVAIGGNTGSGSSNFSGSEFGERVEQYLSAALLRANVSNPAQWPIDCFDNMLVDDPFFEPNIPPCVTNGTVEVFASGLRNMYDFTWNPVVGQWYGPDNGLGVTGTVPPQPGLSLAYPPCFGPGSVANDDPGQQDDILLRLLPGKYYGHPNPARSECVFKDGSFQGVPALPNYMQPLLPIGLHTSTNGIITYLSQSAFCGALYGDLLMLNYSVGDDLIRVQLNQDGTQVLGPPESLVTGFNNPLCITQSPDGVIFVGEFGGNQITVLVPQDTGCWQSGPDLPDNVLDVAGAELNGDFFVIAGKTSSGPTNAVYTYEPVSALWSVGPTRPGIAVENPAVVTYNGEIYTFGGSQGPFSGMVAEAQVYNPTSGWASLAPMPTPRGGAAAQVVGNMIYVIGGLLETGASTDVVEVYDPATDTWSTATPMLTPRDNPGSASIGGEIFVFGGRTRFSNGSGNGTLQTAEKYDPISGVWTSIAPMPTGRRTFASVTHKGRALAIGGEATTSGGAFENVEEYDPITNTWRTLAPMLTPRHGCAGVNIAGEVYVAGGGIVAGSSFSSILEILSFPSGP